MDKNYYYYHLKGQYPPPTETDVTSKLNRMPCISESKQHELELRAWKVSNPKNITTSRSHYSPLYFAFINSIKQD